MRMPDLTVQAWQKLFPSEFTQGKHETRVLQQTAAAKPPKSVPNLTEVRKLMAKKGYRRRNPHLEWNHAAANLPEQRLANLLRPHVRLEMSYLSQQSPWTNDHCHPYPDILTFEFFLQYIPGIPFLDTHRRVRPDGRIT